MTLNVRELGRLLGEATPGPWHKGYVGNKHVVLDSLISLDSENWVPSTAVNAALIVALRNQAPALLERLALVEDLARRLAGLVDATADPLWYPQVPALLDECRSAGLLE